MKRAKLQDMSVSELVEWFVAIALEQDKALLMNEIAKVNRLFDRLEAVEAELKARDNDQRRALLRLYDHSNAQVQLKAAKATLAVASLEARSKLKAIADSHEQPQAGEAGMSLWNLERGIFKPT